MATLRMRLWVATGLCGIPWLVAACQIVAGLDDPLPAGPSGDDASVSDASPDASDSSIDGPSSNSDARLDSPSDSFGDDGQVPLEAGADAPFGLDGGCPTTQGGPAMINVGPFCIDSTEVTNAQYNAFLQSAPSLGLEPPVCAWNTVYVPVGTWPYPAAKASNPIVNVNWCKAYAFCKWAGKRMCGSVDGGPAAYGDFAAANNQHYYACSASGQSVYPYGSSYVFGACNDPEVDAGGTVPVASLKGCVGGFPGLYDMVGNVEEWQDSCQGDGGATDYCLDGTGAYDFPSVASGSGPPSCASADSDGRNAENPDLGIRCCAP